MIGSIRFTLFSIASSSLLFLQLVTSVRTQAQQVQPPGVLPIWTGMDGQYEYADQACDSFFPNYTTYAEAVSGSYDVRCTAYTQGDSSGIGGIAPVQSITLSPKCPAAYQLAASDVFAVCLLSSWLSGKHPVIPGSSQILEATPAVDVILVPYPEGEPYQVINWRKGDVVFVIAPYASLRTYYFGSSSGDPRTLIEQNGKPIVFIYGVDPTTLDPYFRGL